MRKIDSIVSSRCVIGGYTIEFSEQSPHWEESYEIVLRSSREAADFVRDFFSDDYPTIDRLFRQFKVNPDSKTVTNTHLA